MAAWSCQNYVKKVAQAGPDPSNQNPSSGRDPSRGLGWYSSLPLWDAGYFLLLWCPARLLKQVWSKGRMQKTGWKCSPYCWSRGTGKNVHSLVLHKHRNRKLVWLKLPRTLLHGLPKRKKVKGRWFARKGMVYRGALHLMGFINAPLPITIQRAGGSDPFNWVTGEDVKCWNRNVEGFHPGPRLHIP